MKLPSLNTAEGVFIGIACIAAAYVVYKLAKGASDIGATVSDTLSTAGNGVAHDLNSLADTLHLPTPFPKQASDDAAAVLTTQPIDFGTGQSWGLDKVSLAQDSDYLTVAVPPSEAPRTDGLNDAEVGTMGGADDVPGYGLYSGAM